jgi:hypothetical protein
MTITYEEALSTLTAMFQEPWDEDLLDSVLRHFEGHMENTVDAILIHGDADPNILVTRLEASKSGATIEDMDAALARELAGAASDTTDRTFHTSNVSHVQIGTRRSVPTDTSTSISNDSVSLNKKTRGIPTTLPEEFLRIPGNNISSDEALARMLQDKLFQDEIRNNPEFAHLARGGRRAQPGQSPHQNSGEDFLKAVQGKKLSPSCVDVQVAFLYTICCVCFILTLYDLYVELGENAKARFQLMAQKIKANIERTKNKSSFGEYSGSPIGGAAERRGLLDLHDDDEQEISFVTEDNTEMRSMDFAYDKRNKSSKQD